jgi:uncharacterized protein
VRRRFDWDPSKASVNARKHDVDFLDALEAFDDPYHLREQDARFDYGEVRERLIGRAGNDIILVVFTEREGLTRLISARKASRRERRKYSRDRG